MAVTVHGHRGSGRRSRLRLEVPTEGTLMTLFACGPITPRFVPDHGLSELAQIDRRTEQAGVAAHPSQEERQGIVDCPLKPASTPFVPRLKACGRCGGHVWTE